MPRHPVRLLVSALVLLAALVSAAPALHAQDSDVLRPRELRGSGQARLYDAVAQLRPNWLQFDGDSVAGEAVSRVVVFVNGLHQGDARVLYTISSADVLSARLRTAEYVRRTDPRFPRDEFDAAIYVATRAAQAGQPAREPGRITVSLDGGLSLRSLPRIMEDAFADAGYEPSRVETDRNRVFEHGDAPRAVVSAGGAIHYQVAGAWGVELTGHRDSKGWSGGYNPANDSAYSANVTGTEGTLLATRRVGRARLGAGAAYRQADLTWTNGFCECRDEVKSSTSAFGVAAEGTFELPLRAPVFPAFRLRARYYPSQKVQYRSVDLEVGGLAVSMHLSLATRF